MAEDFLLELRSEEIPARMQDKARADLTAMFEARLSALNLPFDRIDSYATPRRLTLIVRGVAETTSAASEERKGPRADAPAQAIEGFLRSTGLTREQLVSRDDGKGGQVLFAVIDRPGVPAGSVLASAATHVIHNFPWPKSMRWGEASATTESLRWVRPLQGIVALLGDKLVPIEVAGVKSGAATVGHRFHHPGVITIGSAADYVEKLRACHVIVDQQERRAIIAVGAKLAAQKAGLELVEDEGLLVENAGLTEWPVPLLGRFDPAFLDVPPEVIQLTARVNQKYFVCRDRDGKLANAFVCVANIEASDDGAKIVEGNQKVLAARLSDARFFYETDLKVPLEEQAKKLAKIVFHEKLGTVADKVERVAKLARWLVEEGIVGSAPAKAGAQGSVSPGNPGPLLSQGNMADLAERAARLAKADLVTGMVGEFPELQGLMGGYYAAAQGEPAEVAAAIRDHYKPVGQGDEVPTAPVTVAVSLADKVDTLTGFFGIDERPTGSKDPFALRRATLAVISLILENNIRVSMPALLGRALAQHGVFWWHRLIGAAVKADALVHYRMQDFLDRSARASVPATEFSAVRIEEVLNSRLPAEDVEAAAFHFADMKQLEIVPFIGERLTVQQREFGVRHDIISAVFTLPGEDDLVRLLARVHALQAFVATEDGANLLAGYKRAANILKKEGFPSAPAKAGAQDSAGSDNPGLLLSQEHDYAPEPAEDALIHALAVAEPMAAASVEAEDFEGAMAALAQLRAPIDAFFDQVTVNDADPVKRAARLGLLARMRDAVHKVADFSKIEG